MTIGGKRQRLGLMICGKRWRMQNSVSEEIVEDILSNLLVKSLSRFMCVSKSILTLITHPQFVKLHLNRTQTQRIITVTSSSAVYCVDLETSLPTFILNPPSHYSCLVGICNGLFYLNNISRANESMHDGDFIIYNPSTRESKTLPDNVSTFSFRFTGFGYAQSVDNYKFIKINSGERRVHIFSLRDNTWKIVQDDDCPYPYYLTKYDDWGNSWIPICHNNGGTSLNGAIVWAVEDLDVNKYIITAFDLVQEKFKLVPTPNNLLFDHYSRIVVGVLGGCLALMCMLRNSPTYISEFWVMKEYGERESWSRILKIDSETTILESLSFHEAPFCFWWRNNEQMILFRDLANLVLYDSKDGAYKDLMIIPNNESRCDMIMQVGLYVKCLVSPNYKSKLGGERVVMEDYRRT